MIGYLKGTVIYSEDRELTILTESGVGYTVFVPAGVSAKSQASDSVELFIETSVREDGIILYGFERMIDKKLFLLLCDVNKVGAKTALTILSSGTSEEIVGAVTTRRVDFFKNISGIGLKTAEKIIIDLRDKVTKLQITQVQPLPEPESRENANVQDAVSGLSSLGYAPQQIRYALNLIDGKELMKAEAIVRAALKIIRNQ
jgi:Holliday junction DNA helicase RuvA